MDANNSKAIAAICQAALDKLHTDNTGILAALIASADGFNLAAIRSDISDERLAAMTSAMHALGEQIVKEVDLQKCHNVMIEAAVGKVLMLNIPGSKDGLIMTAVANEAMVFGSLLFACRQCATQIGEKLAASRL